MTKLGAQASAHGLGAPGSPSTGGSKPPGFSPVAHNSRKLQGFPLPLQRRGSAVPPAVARSYRGLLHLPASTGSKGPCSFRPALAEVTDSVTKLHPCSYHTSEKSPRKFISFHIQKQYSFCLILILSINVLCQTYQLYNNGIL